MATHNKRRVRVILAVVVVIASMILFQVMRMGNPENGYWMSSHFGGCSCGDGVVVFNDGKMHAFNISHELHSFRVPYTKDEVGDYDVDFGDPKPAKINFSIYKASLDDGTVILTRPIFYMGPSFEKMLEYKWRKNVFKN